MRAARPWRRPQRRMSPAREKVAAPAATTLCESRTLNMSSHARAKSRTVGAAPPGLAPRRNGGGGICMPPPAAAAPTPSPLPLPLPALIAAATAYCCDAAANCAYCAAAMACAFQFSYPASRAARAGLGWAPRARLSVRRTRKPYTRTPRNLHASRARIGASRCAPATRATHRSLGRRRSRRRSPSGRRTARGRETRTAVQSRSPRRRRRRPPARRGRCSSDPS